jgi:hypothetical protein
MILLKKSKLEDLLFKLSIITGAVVLLLSILNGYQLLMIILRTILSSSFIYVIGKGFLRLWEKISLPPQEGSLDYRSKIDILLGDSQLNDEQSTPTDQEITIPGQINPNMKNELQDAKNKAEMVRKMGWEEE